jgi:hypothetical protein
VLHHSNLTHLRVFFIVHTKWFMIHCELLAYVQSEQELHIMVSFDPHHLLWLLNNSQLFRVCLYTVNSTYSLTLLKSFGVPSLQVRSTVLCTIVVTAMVCSLGNFSKLELLFHPYFASTSVWSVRFLILLGWHV